MPSLAPYATLRDYKLIREFVIVKLAGPVRRLGKRAAAPGALVP